MKHNFLLKAAFTLLMCGSITMASAIDIYLSNTGSDTNDGLSTGTPVKTLSKAFTIALAGDVINVMNMIDISAEPKTSSTVRGDIDITRVDATKTLTQNGATYTTWNIRNGTEGIIPPAISVSIVGVDKASCGFDGNNVSCIIRQDHGTTGTATITYKNLTFKNGKSADNSGGGAVYFRLSNTTETGQAGHFINCDFIANKSKVDKPGGAISVVQFPGVVSFTNCRFAENIASKGAGLYVERGTVTIDNCVFEDHDLTVSSDYLTGTATPPAIAPTAASVGAAVHANLLASGQTLILDVKNTLFKNNKVGANGAAFSSSQSNSITAGTMNMKFTNCAFVDNTTLTGTGGAVYINNIHEGPNANIAFINSTFKNNLSGSNAGGAVSVNLLYAGSTFDMINCTVSDNKVTGSTGVAGAGVRFQPASANSTRRILNCIIENNTAMDANMAMPSDYADLGMGSIVDPTTLAETPSYVAGTTLIIEKSLIGKCDNADFSTQFPNNNSNYVFELNGSIVNSYVAKLGTFDEEKYYFPLLAGSEAIAYGNATYLTSLTPSVTTDQIGRNRPATAISAGAYEYETVSSVKNTKTSEFKVYRNTNNQLIINTSADKTGNVTILNMMGQIVLSAPLTGEVTTIQNQLKAGAYVIKMTVNGETSSQKVVLN